MSDHDKRIDDDPWARKARICSDLVSKLGFPILVVIWLAWRDQTQGRETINTLNAFKEVVSSLKISIDQQNRILKHKSRASDDD